MVSAFHLPPTGFGPGSQPSEDDLELAYLALPSGMRTYAPHLPELGDPRAVTPALSTLADIAEACAVCAETGQTTEFDLSGMDAENRQLMAETLGQGEVAMRLRGLPALRVQESVFAGVWAMAGEGVDRVEVAPVPSAALSRAFNAHRPAEVSVPLSSGVGNAPSLLAELADKSRHWQPGAGLHVVNLTLLPHGEEDLLWLDRSLGEGAVTILSRGYGNCRITATALPQVWRVQFFNSMDALILDTFEVTAMPEAALAAREDLSDSGTRLLEVLEAIR